MTSPSPLSPLQRYLGAQVQTDREMRRLFREATNEAERLIETLAGKDGIGAQVRRAQYQSILRNLRVVQAETWGTAGKVVREGMARAAQAASEAEKVVNRLLFNALGGPISLLEAAMDQQAKETVGTLLARAANDIPLSEQVYRSRAVADGLVSRAVNRSILLGQSWKELADNVHGLISPDTPGGASYAAKRLGRTELNNAFHRTQIDQRREDPFVSGMKWHLSRTHPKADDCDTLANSSHFRGGDPGVFKPSDVPRKPHPQCLCFLTSVSVSEEEFVQSFLNGNYDEYIDDKVYRYVPDRAPC